MSRLSRRWSEDELERWEEIRSRGRNSFIVRYGILSFGGAVFFILMLFVRWQFLTSDNFQPTTFGIVLSIVLLACVGLGYLVGSALWNRFNTSYDRQRISTVSKAAAKRRASGS